MAKLKIIIDNIMAEQTREINFNTSMDANKRDGRFCYLKENVYDSESEGMYPGNDFREKLPNSPDEFPVDGEVVAHEKNLIFIWTGTETLIYSYSGSGGAEPVYRSSLGSEVIDSAAGKDVRVLCENGLVYRVSYSGVTTNLGYMNDNDSGGKIMFDGLFYFFAFDDKLYRQIEDAVFGEADKPVLVFNDTGSGTVKSLDEFGSQLILFIKEGLDTKALFWDKSDPDLFDKRIHIKNERYLGSGNVDGRMMLVTGVGNRTNRKEKNGIIKVAVYNGERFAKKRSIKAGEEQLSSNDHKVGSGILLVAVTGNQGDHNKTLYNDFVLKIKNDGEVDVSVETIFKGYNESTPNESGYLEEEIKKIAINYDYISLALEVQKVDSSWTCSFRENIDFYDDYDTYAEYDVPVVYITNFLNNAFNNHKLSFVGVSFEEIFDDEELKIYFRKSERAEFELIGTIDKNTIVEDGDKRRDPLLVANEDTDDTIGMHNQIIYFTKMPDGETALPEFNEGQFKFESKDGASIINAWYGYDYIARNTKM